MRNNIKMIIMGEKTITVLTQWQLGSEHQVPTSIALSSQCDNLKQNHSIKMR